MKKRIFILPFLCIIFSCSLFQKDEEKTEPQGIEISPGEDIQAIVDANPAGSTYILKSGAHRMLGRTNTVLHTAFRLSGPVAKHTHLNDTCLGA